MTTPVDEHDDKTIETRSTWSGFERLVAFRLDDTKDRLERIEVRLQTMDKDLRAVEIKAGMWGLLAGLIPAAIIIVVALFTTGCVSTPGGRSSSSITSRAGDIAGDIPSHASLDMLSWIGGISIIGGIAALVITRGSMGVRALAIGVGLILLNYAVARYAVWVFLPVLIATGSISLAYGYKIVKDALRARKVQHG